MSNNTKPADHPDRETVEVRQGTGPRAMVSVLFLSLSVAAVGAGATFVSGTIVADFDMTKRFRIEPYGLAQLYEQPGIGPPSDAPPAAAAAG